MKLSELKEVVKNFAVNFGLYRPNPGESWYPNYDAPREGEKRPSFVIVRSTIPKEDGSNAVQFIKYFTVGIPRELAELSETEFLRLYYFRDTGKLFTK